MAEGTVKTTIMIPQKIFERGKIRAVKERTTFTALMVKALKEYLAKPLKVEKEG